MATTYATIADVQARLTRELSADEEAVCTALLQDSAVLIDAVAPNAGKDAKMVVSCRMVIRALGDGSAAGVPMGATQGSMSGLGYSQSWTIGSGGSTGELYLAKTDKLLLGAGNQIGAYSPAEWLTPQAKTPGGCS